MLHLHVVSAAGVADHHAVVVAQDVALPEHLAGGGCGLLLGRALFGAARSLLGV